MSKRLLLGIGLLCGGPAFAQLDLTGIWSPVFHEDQPERIPGPELVDYLGLPINARGPAMGAGVGSDRG